MVRIAIIGGGIGGLTTAIALQQIGLDAEVYEQAPALVDVGAAIAIWPNAMRVLEKLGLAEKILQKAGEINEIQWRDRRGRLINRIVLVDVERKSVPAVALHRADLQAVLLHGVNSTSVHLGNSLTSYAVQKEEVSVNFANGHSIVSDFLIGADGIHSHVRTQMLSETPPTYRGYMVWRGIAPIVPNSLTPATAIELQGTGKRFGIGPVGLGRTGWWASANGPNTIQRAVERSADRQLWKQGESVTPSRRDTQSELLRLFDGWYRPVLQLIEATPSLSILKTGAFDRPADTRCGEDRVTLLGDATHPMTPDLGQGGCIAIEDAMVLARCFEKYGADKKALRVYEQLRHSRTSSITNYSRVYGAMGQWESIWARGFRRSALSLVPEVVARRLMKVVFDYDVYEVKV